MLSSPKLPQRRVGVHPQPLVVIFLEQAELAPKRSVLQNAGSISNEQIKHIAHERYDEFDAQRRRAERVAYNEADLQDTEALHQSLDRKPQ